MKTEHSIRQSMIAAQIHALGRAENIERTMQLCILDPDLLVCKLPQLRIQVAELAQRLHEFSAYHNTLNTK